MATRRLRTLPIVLLLLVSSLAPLLPKLQVPRWINQSIMRPRAVSPNLARNFDEHWSIAIKRYKTIPAIIALS
jgi:hypothetical protein